MRTKAEIKAAVENCSKLKLTRVRTLNVKGKTKRHGSSFGKRNDWKKAYVVLKKVRTSTFVARVRRGLDMPLLKAKPTSPVVVM